MRWVLILLVLVAGCASDEAPARARVEPPTGTEWAKCPPPASRGLAVGFRAGSSDETGGRPAGIHRLDDRTFLFVWGSYVDTLREDRVTRVNPVEVALDNDGVTHLCTRIDISAPTDVDAQPRSYEVGVLIEATQALPTGPVRAVVNWVAGCPCDPLPRGNATALFE